MNTTKKVPPRTKEGDTRDNTIIIRCAIRFGKFFCKIACAMLALLGLTQVASLLQGGGVQALLGLIAAILAENWALGAWFVMSKMTKDNTIIIHTED